MPRVVTMMSPSRPRATPKRASASPAASASLMTCTSRPSTFAEQVVGVRADPALVDVGRGGDHARPCVRRPGSSRPPPTSSPANRSSSSAITFATALGFDCPGVSMRSRSAENSPWIRSTGAALMPLPPKSMPIGSAMTANLATPGRVWSAEPLASRSSRPSRIRDRKELGCVRSVHVLEEPQCHVVLPCPPVDAVAVFAAAVTGLVPLVAAVSPAGAAPTPPTSSSPRCTAVAAARRRPGTATTWSCYNPTDEAVDLSGTSVQYRSAGGTGNPSGVTPLSGSIPAEGYFLVGEAGSDGRRPAGARRRQ